MDQKHSNFVTVCVVHICGHEQQHQFDVDSPYFPLDLAEEQSDVCSKCYDTYTEKVCSEYEELESHS